MILGGISFDQNTTVSDEIINSISETFAWSGCSQLDLKHHNAFSAKFLYNANLPCSAEDFFFYDKEADTLVLIDGWIYNAAEIKKNLLLDHPVSNTAELIFHAFNKWGSFFANTLNGDFSICIYNHHENKTLLYRDHLGIRPISYSLMNSILYFGSDPIGLSKSLFKKNKSSQAYLLNFFLSEGSSNTILPNPKVVRLNPGHFVEVSKNKIKITQYWFPEKIKTDFSLTFQQAEKDLKTILADAVKVRSDKNFIASAHVSSGIDSGVIAALTRKEYKKQEKFFGFSWSPNSFNSKEKIAYDERILVNKICQALEITPVFISFSSKNFIEQFRAWRYPISYLFEKKVLEKASKNNINLIFSGWGGDEFISIGNRGIDPDLIRSRKFAEFFKKYPIKDLRRLINALIFNVFFPNIRRKHLKLKTSKSVFPFIEKNIKTNHIPKKDRFRFSSRRLIHLNLIKRNHLAARTESWYILGQRYEVEYRYPLLDKRIVEYFLKIPSHCLVRGRENRIIMRSIGYNLLPEIVVNNTSKDDPIISTILLKLGYEVVDFLISEVDHYKQNNELQFVDFKLLESEIEKYSKSKSRKIADRISGVLFSLKAAHEFTLGYNQ